MNCTVREDKAGPGDNDTLTFDLSAVRLQLLNLYFYISAPPLKFLFALQPPKQLTDGALPSVL